MVLVPALVTWNWYEMVSPAARTWDVSDVLVRFSTDVAFEARTVTVDAQRVDRGTGGILPRCLGRAQHVAGVHVGRLTV